MSTNKDTIDILILGAGWTSTFLIPLLKESKISYAATTRAGSETTLPFTFDPKSSDPAPFASLPSARTVLITFPILGAGGSSLLVSLYTSTHSGAPKPNFIQLGSTGIWTSRGLTSRHTPPDPANQRGIAEDELLSLGGAVLNLAGLWGGTRDPRNWVARIAKNKEEMAEKGSLHLIHGRDVARAIVAVHTTFSPGERWLVTDLRIYDWWDLASAWDEGSEPSQAAVKPGGEYVERGRHACWVKQLMLDRNIVSLPRSLGEMNTRGLDSLMFWSTYGIMPSRALVTRLAP